MASDYKLIEGDCIEMMKSISDSSIDMIFVDPPYGTTQCKWDTTIPFDHMWQQVNRVLKGTGVAAITSSQPFTSALVMSNPHQFRHEWIWIKNRGSNFANTVREPMKEHESVLIFSRGKWTYNKQMQLRTGGGLGRTKYSISNKTKSENYGKFSSTDKVKRENLRVPSSWQKFNTASGSEKTKHPTQKPVDLMAYMIRTYSSEGEFVLDFAMGSGSTGVAALQEKRKFIGIESDPDYFTIAVSRMEAVIQ